MSKELKPFPSGSLSAINWCRIDAAERCPYIDGPENCGIKRRLFEVPLKGGAKRREAERLWKLAQTDPGVFYNLCLNGLYGRLKNL